MIWKFCILVLLLSSCQQKSQERHYIEVVVPTPQVNTPGIPAAQTMPADQTMPVDPHAGLDMSAMAGLINAPVSQSMLAWRCPEAWKEEAGTHMRIASFYLASDPKAIDCSIVVLGGLAGGLEANLTRWSSQIGVQASRDHLKQLVDLAQVLKTKDGLEVKVFDFTAIQPQANPSDKSMLAAMMALDDTTVFVKMTGSNESVKQNKDNFLKLLRSMTRK